MNKIDKKSWYLSSGKIIHTGLFETFMGWKTKCGRTLTTISDKPILEKDQSKFSKCKSCLSKIKKYSVNEVSNNKGVSMT